MKRQKPSRGEKKGVGGLVVHDGIEIIPVRSWYAMGVIFGAKSASFL
jgi:hypothetical protein